MDPWSCCTPRKFSFLIALLTNWIFCGDGCLPGINLNWTQDIKGVPNISRSSNFKSAPGDWGPWQSWTQCSTSCGKGDRSRFRSCVSSQACFGDGSETQDCDQPPCATWSDWMAWSPCSSSCGLGFNRRERFCIAKPGDECDGNREEIKPCESQNCSRWTNWGSWGSCSVTCGEGRKIRKRTCSKGSNCPGTSQDETPCSNSKCTSWKQWNQWSKCSASCGEGFRLRTRDCERGRNCIGEATTIELCELMKCVTDIWSPWSPWGPCDNTCGASKKRTRLRNCLSPGEKCRDPDKEESNCPVSPCPSSKTTDAIESKSSEWTDWGPCSSSCGFGLRIRKCADKTCPGPALEHCQETVCVPPKAEWLEWGDWGSCSVTCGSGMTQRKRKCPIPDRCIGESHEHNICFGPSCPSFGPWGSWGKCTGTANPGTKLRRRQCLGGFDDACDGPYIETSSCTLPPTDTTKVEERANSETLWTPWLQWSSCSVSCGVGQRVRSRLCVRGAELQEGNCPGVGVDTKLCIDRECESINSFKTSDWESWMGWSDCSTTCGPGMKTRHRKCYSRSRPCLGESYEELPCNMRNCVLSTWESWSPWTKCSVTCGAGFIKRIRSCSGDSCPGDGSDIKICITGKVCDFTSTSTSLPNPWGPWTSCNSICGPGTQIRKRDCSSNPCFSTQERICDSGSCTHTTQLALFSASTKDPFHEPNNFEESKITDNKSKFWSTWLSWSSCTATCGPGTRGRRRFCVPEGCDGSAFDTEPCENTIPCNPEIFRDWPGEVTNSSKVVNKSTELWGDWSSCSVSCGEGIQTRKRICISQSNCSEPRSEKRSCSSSCPDVTEEVFKSVAQPADLSNSTWMDWMPCSVSCGSGYQTRYRNCTNSPSCPETDIRLCNTDLDCSTANSKVSVPQVTVWMEWSDCSVTCGAGYKTRYRNCYKEKCLGPETDITKCIMTECERSIMTPFPTSTIPCVK